MQATSLNADKFGHFHHLRATLITCPQLRATVRWNVCCKLNKQRQN